MKRLFENVPPQETILLERMVYCVKKMSSSRDGDKIGIVKLGQTLHSNHDVPNNPVEIFTAIFNNYFNSEAGIEAFNRFSGGLMGNIYIVPEDTGGEWVKKILFKDSCGTIHLTTWDY